MKKCLFFILTTTQSILVGQTDTLTNDKIIKLSKLGLQSSVIMNKIQSSYTNFDVGTDALIYLSENGVTPEVINKMMNKMNELQIKESNQKDMKDPLTMRSTGIYYFNSANKEKPLRRVDPTVVSVNSTGSFGNRLAQAYTGGLAQTSEKSIISGAKSRLQINTSYPILYFYFDHSKNPNSDSWFFASATSPNEFVLIDLKEKNDCRQLSIGLSNSYGGSSGIPNRVKIPFEYEEVGEGIYKVTFKQGLKKGEYCFLYASSTPDRFSNNKVFDFGISVETK